jgi:Cytochrome c1
MKQILTALILVLVPVLAVAAGGGGQLDNMEPDLSDKASLQRGAKIFTNNCMGCHSAQYARYKGVAEDIGIPQELYEENLIFYKFTVRSEDEERDARRAGGTVVRGCSAGPDPDSQGQRS